MFSSHFIEHVQKERESNKEALFFEINYGGTTFVLSSLPLEDETGLVFQGHFGEGEELVFVYLK